MAKPIKNIPPLYGKEAKSFIRAFETAGKNRATIDFCRQVSISKAILEKAKLLNERK